MLPLAGRSSGAVPRSALAGDFARRSRVGEGSNGAAIFAAASTGDERGASVGGDRGRARRRDGRAVDRRAVARARAWLLADDRRAERVDTAPAFRHISIGATVVFGELVRIWIASEPATTAGAGGDQRQRPRRVAAARRGSGARLAGDERCAVLVATTPAMFVTCPRVRRRGATSRAAMLSVLRVRPTRRRIES